MHRGPMDSGLVLRTPRNDGERGLLHQLGGEQGKRVTAFSAVIPGRPQGEPGIHFAS